MNKNKKHTFADSVAEVKAVKEFQSYLNSEEYNYKNKQIIVILEKQLCEIGKIIGFLNIDLQDTTGSDSLNMAIKNLQESAYQIRTVIYQLKQ